MNDDLTRALATRLSEEGYEVRPYSGRAMYGERCIGVDLEDTTKLLKLGIDIMQSADGAELLYGEDSWRIVDGLRTDSMGRGIIAYWPSLTWPEGFSPPVSLDALRERLDEDYGQDGLNAMEASCLTAEDLTQGYDHCVDRIRPALEEMM